MNILQKIGVTLGISSLIVCGAAASSSQAFAACSGTGAQCAKEGSENANTGSSRTGDLKTVVQTITNVLLFLVGVIAVIMIVIGGLKYTASNGDSNQITSAKNTILYAVIGLIVAMLAYALVQFVIDAFI